VKALRTLRGPLAAVVIATALSVSGCGTADTAAVVNGQVISESEAQQAAREINEAFTPQTPFDTPSAVSSLIAAPIINDVAKRVGKGESDAAARSAIPNVSEPAQATIDLVKANFALQRLTEPEKQMILDDLKKADITVNPRYGAFDADNASLEAPARNWLKVTGEG
jgi:parvulin-like peptidyl-prolyl isomerase